MQAVVDQQLAEQPDHVVVDGAAARLRLAFGRLRGVLQLLALRGQLAVRQVLEALRLAVVLEAEHFEHADVLDAEQRVPLGLPGEAPDVEQPLGRRQLDGAQRRDLALDRRRRGDELHVAAAVHRVQRRRRQRRERHHAALVLQRQRAEARDEVGRPGRGALELALQARGLAAARGEQRDGRQDDGHEEPMHGEGPHWLSDARAEESRKPSSFLPKCRNRPIQITMQAIAGHTSEGFHDTSNTEYHGGPPAGCGPQLVW